MHPLPPDQQQKLFTLLETASRIIGLHLCFHDRTGRLTIDSRWRTHEHLFCRQMRNANEEQCIEFDMIDTHTALVNKPQGRIQTCHAGVTEIAVPVSFESQHGGVLFAGPCWTNDTPSPPNVPVAPDSQWLEDRQLLLQALAVNIEQYLMGVKNYVPEDRRQQINRYLTERMDLPIKLDDLAKSLHLSSSRTSHLVQQLFGTSLTQLVRTRKMREAAILLTTTGHQVKAIARLVGFSDPNYFARQFTQEHGMSPLSYRKRYQSRA